MNVEKISDDQVTDKLLDDNGLRIFLKEIKKYINEQIEVGGIDIIDGGELSTASEPGIIYDGGYL